MESANQIIGQHTAQIGDVVQASSKVLEKHADKIVDAVTHSEEIVDKRQDTIFQTQLNGAVGIAILRNVGKILANFK